MRDAVSSYNCGSSCAAAASKGSQCCQLAQPQTVVRVQFTQHNVQCSSPPLTWLLHMHTLTTLSLLLCTLQHTRCTLLDAARLIAALLVQGQQLKPQQQQQDCTRGMPSTQRCTTGAGVGPQQTLYTAAAARCTVVQHSNTAAGPSSPQLQLFSSSYNRAQPNSTATPAPAFYCCCCCCCCTALTTARQLPYRCCWRKATADG
jgi:hypothetical protein